MQGQRYPSFHGKILFLSNRSLFISHFLHPLRDVALSHNIPLLPISPLWLLRTKHRWIVYVFLVGFITKLIAYPIYGNLQVGFLGCGVSNSIDFSAIAKSTFPSK